MHPHLAALIARPIAHRGLHGCGRTTPIENSLGAARAAMAAGFGIECDVQLSRDGEAMVFHDAELGRLTSAHGRVADHDAAELGQLALRGSEDKIPTLRQLLETLAGRAPLVVEIKSRDDGDVRLAARTLEVLAGYGGPVAVESFDPVIVRYCLAHTDLPVGLVGPAEGGGADETAITACAFVSWGIDDLARVAAAHPDVPRSTWTVRTPEQVDVARRCGAQIVFEGFLPAALTNRY